MTLLHSHIFIFCLFCIICNGGDAKKKKKAQQVLIRHPNQELPFLGISSEYSEYLKKEQTLFGKLIYPTDPLGCGEWRKLTLDPAVTSIGIVDRGTCNFLEKSKYAQMAGLDALFVVSEDNKMTVMGSDEKDLAALKQELNTKTIIPSFMVGQKFQNFLLETGNDKKMLSITEYESKPWDSAMIVMILMSTFLVGLAAYYSSDAERAKMYNTSTNIKNAVFRQRVEVQELDSTAAWSFVIVASIGLCTLYFFVQYVFIIVVIIFCFGSTNGLSTLFAHGIDYFWPNLQNTKFHIKRFDLEFNLSDALAFVPAAFLTMFWFCTRREDYAWMFQNVMCIGLLMQLQRSIRIPNFRVSTILLGTAFLYDIFWVFLSPLFFQSSVMMSVATYQHQGDSKDTLPVVLKFPRLNDIFHTPMILGLGDVALPGLLVSYLLRFDYLSKFGMSWTKGYFLPSLAGYCIGMCATDLNLILMRSGQPALLFLVPGTLGLTAVLAYRRGHLEYLWNGKPAQGVQYTRVQTQLSSDHDGHDV